jgi:DNA-binding LytR/AlgR family response regulator
MKLSCLIIDDEPIACEVLESYIALVETLELRGKYRSAVDAFARLQTEAVDLLFLDIELPQLSGWELLKALPAPPKVIITSAYREYALDGYEFDVADYLLKPIPFDRFVKAIGKVTRQATPPVAPPAETETKEAPFVFVKEDRKLVRVYLRDILFLESMRDYVKIKTRRREIVTRHTIAYFEELLPQKQFIRVHRSFIVAVAQIEAVSEHKIEVGGVEIAIGGNYKGVVYRYLSL